MCILGITFDSKLQWKEHINSAIKSANSTLFAIKIVRKYFNTDELKTMLTSMYFSKLYYADEIWHIPGLSRQLKKNLKFASANALKICVPNLTVFHTHTQIHNLAGRALPEQMCNYRNALSVYKLFNNQSPDNEFMNLNFQLNDNQRSTKISFHRMQSYDVGKNILINRLSELNNKIEKSWLNLSWNSYKVKCKELFLTPKMTN